MSAFVPFGQLGRYLMRQNMFLMLVCLGAGTCIYLLSDVFDRLDDFMAAGLGLGVMLQYFVFKLPLIISQLLPAVFLLAMVIQLGLLIRSREMTALQAGGVSLGWFLKFFLIYAMFWAVAQFGFSQVLGVWGEAATTRIWKEDVRKRQITSSVIEDLWFREGEYIVEAREVDLGDNRASGITVYEFDQPTQRLVRIITAEGAAITPDGWTLNDILAQDTRDFTSIRIPQMFIAVHKDMNAFLAVDKAARQMELPFWELWRVIRELDATGANVSMLRTSLHAKVSYAGALLVMAILALALAALTRSVYVAVARSLLAIFAFYGTYTLGISAGQKGLLPPVMAAWAANVVFAGAGLARIAWISHPGVQNAWRKTLALVGARA